jgi:phosphopentomutase
MKRGILIVLDSLGVGGAPDAASFGDAGADTLGHIALSCDCGDGDKSGVRRGPLRLPHMVELGLGECCRSATGDAPRALGLEGWRYGAAGAAAEVSTGKDSQSGHWEIAGCPVEFDWGYFPKTQPCFPRSLVQRFCERAGVEGILGNCHASGTEIIARLGDEHIRSGQPICYTSADSVFQIAAHEEHFGLERLYRLCEIARELVDPLRVGRVIARPFVTTDRGYERTAHRRDYGVVPTATTLLHEVQRAHREVISVGKIGDLFCHDATGRELKGESNDAVFDQMLYGLSHLADGGLMMVNLVDFDTLYGHRRDPGGYAAALEHFDTRLPEFTHGLQEGDRVVITGDHGCDPTWTGSDHTRECIPVLMFGSGIERSSIGKRETFADIGATFARHLHLPSRITGHPFL